MIAHAEMVSITAGAHADASKAFLTWMMLGMCHHVCWIRGLKDLIKNGPFWCRIAICKRPRDGQDSCRLARYYKCRRRSRNRRNGGSGCCFYDLLESHCPFSKLQMPPPLPFRRRRIAEPSTSEESQDSQQSNLTTQIISDDLGSKIADNSSSRTTETKESDPTDLTSEKKSTKSKRTRTRSAHLIDLARMQHWPLLIEQASRHRKEARHVDADGLLPIHWAVSGGPPVEAVRALLQAFPQGASAVDKEGSTALHFATHYGASATVVDLLLSSYEPAVHILDTHGRSPLYHAVDKSAGVDVLQKLIRADPSMITTPCLPHDEERAKKARERDERPLQHRTPLFLAWARVLADRSTRERRKGRLWDKADLLLQTASAYHSSRQPYRMLHAAVFMEVYLPSEIVDICIQLFPTQLLDRRQDGRTPLAIAAATQQLTMNRSQELIRQLLDANPKAAHMFDLEGNFPLSLAVASGKSWTAGVKDLFYAEPNAIRWRDGEKVYPALLAASCAPAQETDCFLKTTRVYSTFKVRENAKASDWKRRVLLRIAREKEEDEQGEFTTNSLQPRQLSTVFELLTADPSIMKLQID